MYKTRLTLLLQILIKFLHGNIANLEQKHIKMFLMAYFI